MEEKEEKERRIKRRGAEREQGAGPGGLNQEDKEQQMERNK